MRYKEPKRIICARCKEICIAFGNRKRYCDECRKIVNRETGKKANRKYWRLRKPKKAQAHKISVCIRCGVEKEHWARGMCHACYNNWNWLKNKLAKMSDSEKHDYLFSRDLLVDKKELSVDDLKKDLGVIK